MYRFVSTPPDPAADNFVIFFFEDINGLPDLTPFASYSVGSDVNRVSTGLTILEQENQVLRTEFSYVATIPPTLLQAGTPYYLAIWNNPGFSLAGWSWASGAAGDTVNYIKTAFPTSMFPWTQGNDMSHSFALSDVP
jgi:hypothetical protein|tara:strand:- start:78 stop:488 length:411 start_codon:yes stop_codon:yes gene_type:complete